MADRLKYNPLTGEFDFSGSGNVASEEDSTPVQSTVSTIDVRGELACFLEGGKTVIQYPPPTFASHYNTNDGSSSAVVPDVSVTTRNVSNPTTEGNPFKIGDWTAGTAQDCHRVNAQSYATPNDCLFEDDTTTFEVNIYDADGSTVLNTHTTAAITGNIDLTVDDIRIQVTGWTSVSGGKYEATVTVSFNIDTLLPNGGRYSVEIIHHNSGTDYTKTQDDIFSDTENLTAALTGVTFTENTPVIVRKSGVYMYDTGSTFNVAVADIDNLNSRSYPTTQVQVQDDNMGLPDLSLSGSDLTSWTNAHDNTNASYTKSDWAINQADYFYQGAAGRAKARYVDWSSGSWVNSSTLTVIIDTYNDDSTRVYEDFTGETNRLEDDLSTSWDSTQNLNTYDGGDNLQVGEGTYLLYPSTDYSAYSPSAGSQPDYSSYSGDAYYYRRMWHTGTAHSNGLFNFVGLTEADITADDLIIEISLNGTDWYNCNEPYLGGSLSDGDGCRINSGTQNMTLNGNLEFTLGSGGATSVSTGGGWGIYIRLTMPDTSTVKLDLMQITNWN